MKTFFALLAILTCSAASAQTYPTVTPLQKPTVDHSYQLGCTPIAFNGDDSIGGVCTGYVYSACSGRGCQPIRYSYNYLTSWDINGIVQTAVLCDMVRTHGAQAPVYTYYNGFISCPVAVVNPNHEVTYVPYGPYSWQYTTYYFVGISDDGLYGLVDSAVVYPATSGVKQN